MKRMAGLFCRIGLRVGVHCIGDGKAGAGCGYRGGVGGGCCPSCGGMLLSVGGRNQADRLRRQWEVEDE